MVGVVMAAVMVVMMGVVIMAVLMVVPIITVGGGCQDLTSGVSTS